MNEFGQFPTEGAIGLLALLIQSGRIAEARLDAALAVEGLTFVKWRALDALVKAESPVSLGAMADLLNCVKSNVTQLADKLQADGLVQRVADQSDRRSILVELTERGHEAHQNGRAALEMVTHAVFTGFQAEDRSDLRHLLTLVMGK